MKRYLWFFIFVAAVALFVRCGKNKGAGIQKELPYGRYVELQPVDLPAPPKGMLYQAWIFRLEESGGFYAAKFHSFQKFGWNGYVYTFTDPLTGADLGRTFNAAPDTQNLFTVNPTSFMRSDSIARIVEKLVRGQRVMLSGAARNLNGMVGFLLSVEPASETGPDTAMPASPFLVGVSNDSGIVTMTYPIDYRGPDFIPSYFLASPSDGFTTLCPCQYSDSAVIQNEARGIWLGLFDSTRVDWGRLAARPDPVLSMLSQNLLPGWKFTAGLERDNDLVAHLGCFYRADSIDLCNSYVFDPDSVFPFPGEDFFISPPPGTLNGDRALLGAKLTVALEPDRPDDSTMFPMVLFQDTIPKSFAAEPDAEGNRHRNIQYNFQMQNRARFFPKMWLRILPEARK